MMLSGILSPAIYIAADVIAARRYPNYSYTDQAVSELFAIDAPTSAFVVLPSPSTVSRSRAPSRPMSRRPSWD